MILISHYHQLRTSYWWELSSRLESVHNVISHVVLHFSLLGATSLTSNISRRMNGEWNDNQFMVWTDCWISECWLCVAHCILLLSKLTIHWLTTRRDPFFMVLHITGRSVHLCSWSNTPNGNRIHFRPARAPSLLVIVGLINHVRAAATSWTRHLSTPTVERNRSGYITVINNTTPWWCSDCS